MGNTLGGRKTAKIMKINGETMKFKTPIQAREIVKDYPGHVVLDSEAVKHYGIRAKPLEPFQNLEPRRLYFLVELPKFPQGHDHQYRTPRRVRSGIHMSAKDRLESLMLSRRSVSDLSIMGPATRVMVDGAHDEQEAGSGLRVRMRLPKSEVEKLMKESRDGGEVVERIVDLCVGKRGQHDPYDGNGNKGKEIVGVGNKGRNNSLLDSSLAQRDGTRGRSTSSYKKRVGFMPIHEAEIGLAVAS